MKDTEFVSIKEYFNTEDIFEAEGKGIMGRGWEKVRAKVLKMFKGPAVKRLVEKYARKFLKEADELIKQYVKISEHVKKDFKQPYDELKSKNEELKKEILNPEATDETIRNYEENKKGLNNKMKILQENIDDYFKINNLNEEIEKRLDDYAQIISDKIEQSNWLLNVELSKKDKSQLMQIWKRKTPHLKMLLKQKFVVLTRKSAIGEIYEMREDLRSMQEETKKVNLSSEDAKRKLLKIVTKAVNKEVLNDEYEQFKDYTTEISIRLCKYLLNERYDDEILQTIITKNFISSDMIDRLLTKFSNEVKEKISNGKFKKNNEIGDQSSERVANTEARIKQRIGEAFEKWIPRERKEGRLKEMFDYTDFIDIIVDVIYKEVITNKDTYGLNAFKGTMLGGQIKKLFYDYKKEIDKAISDAKEQKNPPK
jgi:hypothetical protein